MKKIVLFVLVFSQPLIGIPLGLVVGTHAAYNCKPEQAISQCIAQEFETWKETFLSAI